MSSKSHCPYGFQYFVEFIQVLKKIAKYIQEQNEKIYAPLGLLLTDPIERGLRVVSFLHLQTKFSDWSNDAEISVASQE